MEKYGKDLMLPNWIDNKLANVHYTNIAAAAEITAH